MNLERKVYESTSQKVIDFFLGVGLFIGLNIAFSFIFGFGIGLLSSMATATTNDVITNVVGVLSIIAYGLPCLIHFGLMVYFGLTRYWIALGMLATIAVGLLLTLLLVAACFGFIYVASGGFGQ